MAGPEQVLGDDGFGVIVKVLQQHPADRVGIHHHMPAFAGAARDHRLLGGDLRNDAEQVVTRRLEALPDTHRFGHQPGT